MTYKELFPKVVERDREEIKETVITRSGAIRDARIDVLLEDAFLRGRIHGVDTVLSDPGAFDLFAREDGD